MFRSIIAGGLWLLISACAGEMPGENDAAAADFSSDLASTPDAESKDFQRDVEANDARIDIEPHDARLHDARHDAPASDGGICPAPRTTRCGGSCPLPLEDCLCRCAGPGPTLSACDCAGGLWVCSEC